MASWLHRCVTSLADSLAYSRFGLQHLMHDAQVTGHAVDLDPRTTPRTWPQPGT
jgi:hypothetical protein